MKHFNDLRKWIGKYRIPFLLSLLFLLLTCPDIFYRLELRLYFSILLGIIFIVSIFLIPFYFFRNHLRIFVLLPALFVFITPAILFPVLKFRIAFDDSIMMLVYNTNKQEARELIGPYLVPIIICFTCIILLLIFIYRFLPGRVDPKKALLTSTVALLLSLTIPVINYGMTPYIKNVKATLYTYYPFYLFYYGNRFYKDLKNMERYNITVKNFRFNASKKDTLKQREVYLLVIGETGRYDHWGINGYHRNTSPLLSRVKSLVSYKNAITGGAFTEVSVPIIITRATPRDFDLAWKEKSIVSVFGEAGFETYWITNQFYGTDRGMIAIHAREADHLMLLQKSGDTDGKLHWDMELADSLQQYIENGPSKMFIVLHTYGSHFEYNKRYPPQFNQFRPSGEGENISPTNPRNKTMLINGYDNSILYTDAVLERIISILNKKGIVGSMLYISDHGENLMDDNRELFLHSPGIVSKYVAHVPFFIFTTDDYNEIYKQQVVNLNNHINSKISSADVFSTLCGMANITFPGWDSTRCISSSSFIDRPQYILGGMNTVLKYADIK